MKRKRQEKTRRDYEFKSADGKWVLVRFLVWWFLVRYQKQHPNSHFVYSILIVHNEFILFYIKKVNLKNKTKNNYVPPHGPGFGIRNNVCHFIISFEKKRQRRWMKK